MRLSKEKETKKNSNVLFFQSTEGTPRFAIVARTKKSNGHETISPKILRTLDHDPIVFVIILIEYTATSWFV